MLTGKLEGRGMSARPRLTFCVHGGHVGPVVPLHDVHHGAGLLGIGRHDPHEVLEQSFVAQIHACGRVGDLRYVEKLEQVLDLNGHRAGAGPDDAHDGLLGAEGRGGAVHAAHQALLLLRGEERVPYELDALLQGHGRVPAGVPDLAAQRDVGQQRGVRVDALQGVQHGLHPLDAVLLPHRPALALVNLVHRGLVVHGEQGPDDDVARHVRHHPPLAGLCAPTDIFFQKQDWQDQQKDHFREGVQANKDSMVGKIEEGSDRRNPTMSDGQWQPQTSASTLDALAKGPSCLQGPRG